MYKDARVIVRFVRARCVNELSLSFTTIMVIAFQNRFTVCKSSNAMYMSIHENHEAAGLDEKVQHP